MFLLVDAMRVGLCTNVVRDRSDHLQMPSSNHSNGAQLSSIGIVQDDVPG